MSRASSALVVLAAACGSKPTPSAAPAVGRALGAALDTADGLREPWRCAALDTPALADEQLATGGRHWKLSGHSLARTDNDVALVIGVVADAGGAAPATLAALARLRARLDQETPDLVLALGGMGSTRGELEATLGALADRASYPVVAVPGDLEPAAALRDAVGALRGRGDAVIDSRLARWIELPGATIATIPGAGSPARLVAGAEGCGWRAEDVAAVYAELSARPGLRIAATAEAPRESSHGDATGELALAATSAHPIDIALHGPGVATATPARGGGRDGAAIALGPGTADATPRLPEPHPPSAGVLAIRGNVWTWRPVGTEVPRR